MDFKVFTKVFTLLCLSLAFALTLFTTDVHVAQAQKKRVTRCETRSCYILSGGSPIGWGNLPSPEEIADLENLVKSGRATIDQHLRLGSTYQVLGKNALAQKLYSTGLELAKKGGDLEGQAIALKGLGEVSAATGRRQEATSRLTEAKTLYVNLGDQQSVREVDQQLIRLPNQRILNNP